MRPNLCAVLLTVTTRASSLPRIASSISPVRAKWPRWLVPSCSSNPSAVWRRGGAITPALLISRSSPAWAMPKRSAKARTEARLERSSSSSAREAAGASARIDATADSPLSRLRQASTTAAPALASACAAASPSPLLAPVTTTVRPAWSGMSAAVHFSAIQRR
jgi:hypothetical protein